MGDINVIEKFDALIVVTSKDYLRLQNNYHQLVKKLPVRNIWFIGDAKVGELVEKSGLGGRVGFINENSILPFRLVHEVLQNALEDILNGQELPRGITGWYYQQFLKMQYAHMCEDTYYMVWDGDTIPCRSFSMFYKESDIPYLDLKREYHEEYFITLSRILPGIQKSIEKSFISEHMLFKCDIMKQLINDIERNQTIPGSSFWEKVINSIDLDKIQKSSFSEFETYGTYVCTKYPTEYRIRNWHSFRQGGAFFNPDTITDEDYEWLSHDFYAISFEKGDFVREDHKNLFDNKKYQEKLSARQMLEIAQEEFEEGYLEIWDEPLQSRRIAKDREKSSLNLLIDDQKEYLIYERMGDDYLYRNIDQAYLCYENAEFLCTDAEKKLKLKAKKENIMFNNAIKVQKTAFIIVSYNNCYLMQKCIESIRQTCALEAYSIIVVDNASTDGVREWLKQQTDIILILNDENVGFPAGCNMGIQKAACTEDIFLLNNDTRMTYNALFWLRMGLYESDSIGAVGCTANYCTLDQLVEVKFSLPGEYLDYARTVNIPCDNPYEEKNRLSGFAMLIKRKVMNITEGLDEAFSPGYFEDEDLCLRILMSGYRLLVCHNSFIYHAGSQSFIKRKDLEKIFEKNHRYMIQKWGYDTFTYSVLLEHENELISQINRKKEDYFQILEVGAGSGSALSKIKYLYPNSQVMGIERNSLAVQNSVKTVPMYCVDWKREPIPFPEKSFDYIIYIDRLAEQISKEEIARFFARYLKESGRILI